VSFYWTYRGTNSNGERGLREVFVELIHRYGKDRPFDNDSFFEEFVAATYPEIEDFIDDHIRQREPLDFAAFLEPVGVRYIESRLSEDEAPQFGLQLAGTRSGRLAISGFLPEHEDFGLREGDQILQVFGEDVTVHNSDSVFARKAEMKAGDEYTVRVLRGEDEIDLTGKLVPAYDHHIFEVVEDATEEQLKMRGIWTANRPS
jgi:predicted metalloprotease with PDZ domain